MHEISNPATQPPDHPTPSAPTHIMRSMYSAFSSVAVMAAMQLDVFSPLGDGPMDAPSLAALLQVREEKITPLLSSLAASGLLTKEGERFANTTEADEFLVRGRPRYLGGQGAFYAMLLDMSLKTAESIRTGQPQAKFDFQSLPEEALLAYFRKQVHSSRAAGEEIADKIDFSRYSRLLDAGGGTGGVAMAICDRYPELSAKVADFPTVANVAAIFIAEAGLSDRIAVSATDLTSRPPIGSYDVAVLRALIQTLSRKDAQKTLSHIGQSMPVGGRIFIFGNVMENSRLGPPSALAFGLVFLNTYDHGQAYTEKEYRDMLAAAGFGDIFVEHEVLIDGMSLVGATKL